MIKKVFMMIVAAALVALPAVAQTFGAQQPEQSNTVFKSTSTMTGSGSQYSANPTLNSDGTAAMNGASYSPAKVSSGPHRAPGDVQEPEGGLDVGEPPVGDPVLPLMLCALAFGMFVYFRRKRSAA